MSTLAVRATPLLLSWTDVVLTLGLGLAALALRLPFQADVLYAWDSVLYARAVESFNVAEGRPHPPGYLLYVGTASLIQVLAADPNRSLVLLSVIGAALAVGLLGLLGRKLFGWPAGIAAAALLATSPLFWFYSEVAYPYTLLAAGAIVLALLSWWCARRQRPGPLGLGLALGLAGGFRLDLTLFLLPMAVWSVRMRRQHREHREDGVSRKLPAVTVLSAVHQRSSDFVVLGLGLMLGTALWYLPTALLSGGLATYTTVLLAQADYVGDYYSLAGHGWVALRKNVGQMAAFTWQALGWAMVPAGYAAIRILRQPTAPWFVLWVLPPMGFYSLVHIGDRGYIFSYLPALCLAAGWGALEVGRLVVGRVARLGIAGPVLGSVLVAGLALAGVFQFLTDRGRHGAYELACFERTMDATVQEIRMRLPPEQTLLYSSFYYQHARYLLPEYPAWRFDPARNAAFERSLPPHVRYVVAFGEDLPATPSSNLYSVPLPCERRLYIYTVERGGTRLVYRHRPPWIYVGR